MKTGMLSLFTFVLMLFSLTAWAEKIIVKGEPVIIEKRADVYVPSMPLTARDYYYFSIDNTKRVCYKEVQPALAKIDAGIFAVRMGNDVVSLHCYDYNVDYFAVE